MAGIAIWMSASAEIAAAIGPGLAKAALIIMIDGKEWDLFRPIEHDAKIRIITKKDPESLELIRHDMAHILAMAVQADLGSDIAMAFDECAPAGAPHSDLESAVERTSRWAERCVAAPRPDGQLRFGIVQGGLEPDLRAESTEFIASLPFDGICFGGLAGDETPDQRDAVLDLVVPLLDGDPRVRYLMGLGSPADLLEAVHRGIDLFDSVLPARVARTGQLWVPGGRLNLRNQRFLDDPNPIQEGCPCLACRTFSRAYIAHLFRAKELLA